MVTSRFGAWRPSRAYFFYLDERGCLYSLYDVTVRRLAAEASRIPPRITNSGERCPLSPHDDDSVREAPPSYWGGADAYRWPTGPSHLREEKFLAFFHRHLHLTPRPVDLSRALRRETHDAGKGDGTSSRDEREGDVPSSDAASSPLLMDIALQFPYVSLCGAEANFLASQDAPVVFSQLDWEDGPQRRQMGWLTTPRFSPQTADGEHDATMIVWQAFDAAALRELDGRLYHPIGVPGGNDGSGESGGVVRPRSVARAGLDGFGRLPRSNLAGPSHGLVENVWNRLSAAQRRYLVFRGEAHNDRSQCPQSGGNGDGIGARLNLTGFPSYALIGSQVGIFLGFDCIDEDVVDRTREERMGGAVPSGRYVIDLPGGKRQRIPSLHEGRPAT